MQKYHIAIAENGEETLIDKDDRKVYPHCDTYECWFEGPYLYIGSGYAGYIADPSEKPEDDKTMFFASPPNGDTGTWKLVEADQTFATWRRQLIKGDLDGY